MAVGGGGGGGGGGGERSALELGFMLGGTSSTLPLQLVGNSKGQ